MEWQSLIIDGFSRVLELLEPALKGIKQGDLDKMPRADCNSMGWIVWRTTSADSKKPGYGMKAEDYKIKTVVLPLVTEEDVEARMVGKQGKANGNYIKQQERDMRVMVRLIKSAYEQGGI